jgi:hypothetical protein
MQVKHHHCLPGCVAGAADRRLYALQPMPSGHAFRHVSLLAMAIPKSGASDVFSISLVLSVWTVLSDIHAIARKALR